MQQVLFNITLKITGILTIVPNCLYIQPKTGQLGDIPSGPVVENLPCNAGAGRGGVWGAGSIPGQGTGISYGPERPSPQAATRQPTRHKERSLMTEQKPEAVRKKKRLSDLYTQRDDEAGIARGGPCLLCLPAGNREIRRTHGLHANYKITVSK